MSYTDIQKIIHFYAKPQGQLVQKIIYHHIKNHIITFKNLRLLGYGFCQPYITQIQKEHPHYHSCIFHDKKHGAAHYQVPYIKNETFQHTQKNKPHIHHASALIDETSFPLLNNSVDLIIAIHALEFSADYQTIIDEILRVLSPMGQAIIIIPHKKRHTHRYPSYTESLMLTAPLLKRHLIKQSLILPSSITFVSFPLRKSFNPLHTSRHNTFRHYISSHHLNPYNDVSLISFQKNFYKKIHTKNETLLTKKIPRSRIRIAT